MRYIVKQLSEQDELKGFDYEVEANNLEGSYTYKSGVVLRLFDIDERKRLEELGDDFSDDYYNTIKNK